MQLFLNTKGISVLTRNKSFHLKTADTERLISPKRITGILVGSSVKFHSSALHLASEYDIPVYYLNRMGEVTGVFRKASFNNATIIRRNQVLFAYSEPDAARWMVNLITAKLENQLQNIRYFQDRKSGALGNLKIELASFEKALKSLQTLNGLPFDRVRPTLLGKEGTQARIYWSVLSNTLPEAYRFSERSKNPSTDPFNAALNYLYGILYTTIETALFTVGLDPFLGIFHSDQYQKPTLAFDMIELFRFWADRFLVELFWADRIQKSFFEHADSSVSVSKTGKQFLVPQFFEYLDKRTLFQGQIAPRRALIHRKAGELATEILHFNRK